MRRQGSRILGNRFLDWRLLGGFRAGSHAPAWEPIPKAKSNLKKHDISFEEAATALYDPMALVQEDTDSMGEYRWIFIGLSSQTILLTIIYTLREEEIIRLISARKATRKEAKYYA